MSKLDPYSNLRGGVLVSVSELPQSTISSWGLQLGHRKDEGSHPRYTIADVAAVLLMKQLRFEDALEATRAAYIVKQIQPRLPAIVARIRRESAGPGERFDKFAPPFLVHDGGRHAVDPNQGVIVHHVDSFDELTALIADAVAPSLSIVSMRVIVKRAMIGLSRDDVQDQITDHGREA
jgi:hypothetical protein